MEKQPDSNVQRAPGIESSDGWASIISFARWKHIIEKQQEIADAEFDQDKVDALQHEISFLNPHILFQAMTI